MQQFASDMNLYISMVCDTIVMTVPKSVVHCMVRKAEKGLLNHMFGHVHAMSEVEIKRMLQVGGPGGRTAAVAGRGTGACRVEAGG